MTDEQNEALYQVFAELAEYHGVEYAGHLVNQLVEVFHLEADTAGFPERLEASKVTVQRHAEFEPTCFDR